jgi:shikimate kinase
VRDLITTTKSNSKSGPGNPRAVLLVGFMGAGKTTAGRELSKRLNSRFLDLDDVIVTKARKPIPQIFADEGEEGFRRRETKALREVIAKVRRAESTVIALGGGAFVQPDNFEVIRRSGFPVVFLDAGIDTLLGRCRSEQRVRPLAQNENQFRQLYEARRSGYMRADHRIDTAGKAIEQIVNEIILKLGLNDELVELP